jgi:toxin ParE1/3/4
VKRYKVEFDVSARDDLASILSHVAENSGERRAEGYLERVYQFCSRLDHMPERFPAWKLSQPSLRIAVFERTLSIAYEVREHSILIVRVLARGRDRDGQLP